MAFMQMCFKTRVKASDKSSVTEKRLGGKQKWQVGHFVWAKIKMFV